MRRRLQRFLRLTFHTTAAVSAVLLVLTVAVWVRGYFVWDDFVWRRPDPVQPKGNLFRWEAFCGSGRLFAMRTFIFPGVPPAWRHSTSPPTGDAPGLAGGGSLLARMGFEIQFDSSGPRIQWALDDNGVAVAAGTEYHLGDGGLELLAFPLWFPAALLAPLPVFWLFAAIRRSRRPLPGHCRRCGYDLRATPGGGPLLPRCPECGAVSTAKGVA